jgi:hypothetical protein
MSEASDPARWRQLSWAAYGNAFLRGHAPFKAWKNHGGFNGITAEFRLPDGSLVARDGFEWLWWLKQGGVQRLSLAMRDDLAELDRYCCPDRQVIVCHYADCDQIWGRFEEKSRAESQADLAGVYFACYFDSPDRFVLAQSQAPTANPPATDWQEVKREVKTRLSRFAALASLARLPLPDGKWLHASGASAAKRDSRVLTSRLTSCQSVAGGDRKSVV